MKKTKNFSKGRKIVISLSVTAMALLLAIVLIGIFYGRQRVLYPVGVLGISDDYPAKTLYRVNQEIYVPVKIDPETKRIVRDIPYYYGTLSESAYNMVFESLPEKGSKLIGNITGDFLRDEPGNPNVHSVYNVQVGSEELDTNDIYIILTPRGEEMIARIAEYYYDEIGNDWYALAERLDLLFSVELWQKEKNYRDKVPPTALADTMYYRQHYSDRFGSFFHEFQKHLLYFWSDVKNFFS